MNNHGLCPNSLGPILRREFHLGSSSNRLRSPFILLLLLSFCPTLIATATVIAQPPRHVLAYLAYAHRLALLCTVFSCFGLQIRSWTRDGMMSNGDQLRCSLISPRSLLVAKIGVWSLPLLNLVVLAWVWVIAAMTIRRFGRTGTPILWLVFPFANKEFVACVATTERLLVLMVLSSIVFVAKSLVVGLFIASAFFGHPEDSREPLIGGDRDRQVYSVLLMVSFSVVYPLWYPELFAWGWVGPGLYIGIPAFAVWAVFVSTMAVVMGRFLFFGKGAPYGLRPEGKRRSDA